MEGICDVCSMFSYVLSWFWSFLRSHARSEAASKTRQALQEEIATLKKQCHLAEGPVFRTSCLSDCFSESLQILRCMCHHELRSVPLSSPASLKVQTLARAEKHWRISHPVCVVCSFAVSHVCPVVLMRLVMLFVPQRQLACLQLFRFRRKVSMTVIIVGFWSQQIIR